MKSTILKSRVSILVLFLGVPGSVYSTPNTGAPNSGKPSSLNSTYRGSSTHPQNVQSCATDEEQLETAIADVFTKFTNNIGMFKSQLNGLIDPHSNEKLKVTCEKLNGAIKQAEDLFIEPIRAEYAEIKSRGITASNYCQLLEVLLNAADELKGHFDRLYKALNKSLQGRPTAIKVAKALKPVIDQVTSDDSFFSIDAYLAKAAELTSPYDITIDIAPELVREITDEDMLDEVYSAPVSQAIESIREVLEELRQECRKPSTLSAGELLRMIRKRL